MKSNKLIFLSVSLFFILTTSCNPKADEPIDVAKWKTQNDLYFTNMKDSAGYILDTIPENMGDSRFYYKITTVGNQKGGSPLSTDIVTVNYRGKMITGAVFDQTYKGYSPVNDSSARPATFGVNGLISGWSVNLMQMKVGEIRTIVLPQELGYGTYYAGIILPYSTLKFDIQLISFHSN